MRSRNSAVIIVSGLIILAAVALAVILIWNRGPAAITPTATVETAITPAMTPTATPTPPGPMTYTVQAGDTLSAIAQAYEVSIEDLIAVNDLADPNLLQVGQTLVIPEGDAPSPTAVPSEEETAPPPATEGQPVTSLPTLTPSGPPLVEIDQVVGVGDLEAEAVIVRNRGGTASLERWTLSGAAEGTFVFPALTLFTDAEVRVHSTAGDATPRDLYWGRAEPAWHVGDLVTLHDAQGNVVDTYVVPQP